VSRELASEAINRINRETAQIVERWDNRVVIPPTKLSERYISGHLKLHVHLWGACQPHISGSHFPRQLLSSSSEQSISLDVDPHNVDSQNEFPMLVNSVHIVNEPKRMTTRVCSLVRLQALDSCTRGGTGDALYFSAISAKFVLVSTTAFSARSGPHIENGELDLIRGVCLEYGRRQLPSQMIEGGSQVMDNLTSENTESRLDALSHDELCQFVIGSPIFISDDWVACGKINIHRDSGNGSQKVGDFPSEGFDILFGPS